jgi:tRNA pseudouridine55 synthase
MNGILLIDKPKGWTSFDVVAKVRSMLRQAAARTMAATDQSSNGRLPKIKVGHTGTLDPLATGLLVLMVGAYTKKVPEFTKLDKTYDVTMRLGQTSTTGDEEGEKADVSDTRPTLEELHIAMARFEGDILQTPPVFSAIKINGKRAYDLARQGKAPVMEPRPVHIERIILTSYDYPDVGFITHVSSGTYIRSLVEDIGRQLGCGAYMADLRRTRVGSFQLKDAVSVNDLTTETIADNLRET